MKEKTKRVTRDTKIIPLTNEMLERLAYLEEHVEKLEQENARLKNKIECLDGITMGHYM